MKKVFLTLVTVFSIFILIGCDKEMPTDSNNKKPPIIIDPGLPPIVDAEFDEPEYSDWKNAPVFYGAIDDEKPAPEPARCFPGAWYRKVATQFDKWLGMEAVVTLPYFTADDDRIMDSGSHIGKYADTPSIYIGGKTTEESDIGLAYEIGCTDDVCEIYSLTEKVAYRPFWRFNDENRTNVWRATGVKQLQYYYFPGDTLRLSLMETDEPNYARFEIEVISLTTDPKYVALRKKFNLPDDKPNGLVVEKIFIRGIGTKTYAQYKRVNAIDQYGREGKGALMTEAYTSDIVWHSTYVFRLINGTLYKVPMTSNRVDDMRCPDTNAFNVTVIDKDGGETNSIRPSRINQVSAYYRKKER